MKTRYNTPTHAVTGNTPDAMEATAIAEAAEMLGVDPAWLAVRATYGVRYAGTARPTDSEFTRQWDQKALENGHRLWAEIAVCEPLPERKMLAEAGHLPIEVAWETIVLPALAEGVPVVLLNDGRPFAEVRPAEARATAKIGPDGEIERMEITWG
jgi:hypothetical protein